MSTSGRTQGSLPKPKPSLVTAAYSPRPRSNKPVPRSAPPKPSKEDSSLKRFIKQLEARFGYLSEPLGQGALGRVYKVKYQGRDCVLKVPNFSSPRNALREEYNKARMIPEHDHLVQYIDMQEETETVPAFSPESMDLDFPSGAAGSSFVALLLEMVEGGSLQDRIKLEALQEEELRYIARDILEGLRHIHEQGYMHLDIKPANIFLTETGRAKIGDFGSLCLHIEYRAHSTNEGDSTYLAPELYGDTPFPVHAPDIFSLGVTLLECATMLEIPKSGVIDSEGYRALREDHCPKLFLEGLSPELQAMVLKMLRQNPNERPDASQLLQDPFFASLPPLPPMDTAIRHHRKSRSTSSPSTPHMANASSYPVASSAPTRHFMMNTRSAITRNSSNHYQNPSNNSNIVTPASGGGGAHSISPSTSSSSSTPMNHHYHHHSHHGLSPHSMMAAAVAGEDSVRRRISFSPDS